MSKTNIKKINIDQTSENNFRLSIGPYKSLKKLKNDFNQMENLYFENLGANQTMKQFIAFLLLIFLSTSSRAVEFNVDAKTAILQDYLSGEILYEKEADMSIYPASMTKIMTSIIAFDLIKKGQLSLDEKFIVSEKCLETC